MAKDPISQSIPDLIIILYTKKSLNLLYEIKNANIPSINLNNISVPQSSEISITINNNSYISNYLLIQFYARVITLMKHR
jgi:ribosomal protein S2